MARAFRSRRTSAWIGVLAAVLTLTLSALEQHSAGAPSDRSRPAARDLVLIDLTEQDRLIDHGVPVTWKGASFFLAEWTAAEQALARSRSIRFTVLLPRVRPDHELFLFELHEGEDPPASWAPHTLHREGIRVLVVMDGSTAASWAETGYHGVRIGHEPRGWGSPASRGGFDCGPDPVTQDLVGRMESARWLDWIEKLSGAEPVEVEGTSGAIQTRLSSRLFTGHAHARGFDFLEQQVATWNYRAGAASMTEVDPYTGNTALEGATWSNLILVIPGQVTPNESVLLTAHFDSRAATTAQGVLLAPGADDNGTGSALLLEAARLLRQFRFERTIKIIWFSGEEQFLLGSAAYVADHSLTNVVGVVNVDMAGYDGNGDRCFEIHVGTLPQSDPVGQCFAASTDLYSPTLNYDYLTAGATDRSDHASFWNASPPVGAIEISENFFSTSSPGGCVGTDTNPNYHTQNDTVAGLAPSFGFDIARAAMATVGAMAGPIGSCFAAAPAITATPGDSVVDLSWTAVPGAATYRVYRSTTGCLGQWSEVGETAGTSWDDLLATEPQSYAYHVEALASDEFCASAASNCATAEPTVHRGRLTGSSLIDTCAAGGPGDGDGIVDPGETVLLPLALLDDGNTSLTSIAGLLSITDPAVSIADPWTAWPDLVPAQSSGSLPDHVTIHVAEGATCGPRFDLDMALTYEEGSNPTELALYRGTTSPVNLIDESFASGIPAGWSVVNGGSGGGSAATWTTANPGSRTIGSPFAAPFAIVDSSAAGGSATQNEQLITPVIDASACRQLTLRFSNQFNYDSGSPYELGDVDVSTNGGTIWTNALRLLAEDNGLPTPNTQLLDLTPLITANPSNVTVRFRFYQAQADMWWAIDNVRIECAAPVCNPCAVAAGPPGEAATTLPLVLRRDAGTLQFFWGEPSASCGVTDYAVYRGDLATLASGTYSHDTSLTCGLLGNAFEISESDPRLGQADYFLVVSSNGAEEGSFGHGSGVVERPVSNAACLAAQNLATCAP